jgi:hypothetical protein
MQARMNPGKPASRLRGNPKVPHRWYIGRMDHAPRAHSLLPALALAALAASGCGEPNEPRVYRAPKEMPSPLRSDPSPHDEAASESPRWSVPAGWIQLPAQQMRFATFQVDPSNPKIAVVVYSFGPESGALLPNVNRWESQIGAPTSSEADLPKVVKKLKSHGLEIDDIDIHGPAAEGQSEGQRMLAAIIRVTGKVWFLKLAGSESVVAAHKAEYDAFLRSIEFEKGASPEPAGSPGLKAYRTPEGWMLDPEPKPMRVATFHVKDGSSDAEVIVSSLPGAQSGSPEANFNRWRGQVGLGPVKDVNAVQSEAVAVGDVNGVLMEFGGTAEPSSSGKQILVVQALKSGSVWYFKLIGPAPLVAAQKKALVSFVGSIEFAPSGE